MNLLKLILDITTSFKVHELVETPNVNLNGLINQMRWTFNTLPKSEAVVIKFILLVFVI